MYSLTIYLIFQNLLKVVVNVSLEVLFNFEQVLIYPPTEEKYLVKCINFRSFSSFVNMEIQATSLTTAMKPFWCL